MLGNKLSWVDLQDFQIRRVLLVSCMWHVEGTGGQKRPQPQPAPGAWPELRYPPPSNLFEQSLGGD